MSGAGRGFSLGTATTTTNSSSLFGGTSAGMPGGGFNFGTQASSAGTGTTASSGTGFNFASSTGGTAAGGLGLGQQALSESLGVNLRTSTGGFGVAGTQASAASTPGFNLATTGGTGSSTGTSSGFNLSGIGTTTAGPAQTTTAAPGGFSFGAAATTSGGLTGLLSGTPSSGTTLGTGSGTGLLSGLLAAPVTTTTTTATGFTLGAGSTAPSAATSSGFKLGASSTTTSTTGLNLGGGGLSLTGGGLKLGSTPTTQSATTTATTTAGGFGFGIQATTSAPGFGLSTTGSSTGGFPLAGAISSSKPSTTTTTTTTTAGVPSRQMNYRQLEDQINKWMIELEEQERLFLQQATQVNAWDRLLVDNGEKITQLNGDMERVKVDQNKLEQELDFIKSQQRELEELLVPMEKSLEMLPNTSLQPHADLERENTYQLADNIDAQLKRMVRDLKEIIDHLNTSSSTQDNNDPILQITRILNAHMDSLQWIDTNTALLNRRVEEIGKQMESQRKNQERDFRLVYD